MKNRHIVFFLLAPIMICCEGQVSTDQELSKKKQVQNTPSAGYDLEQNINQSELVLIGKVISAQPFSGNLHDVILKADSAYDRLTEIKLDVIKVVDGSVPENTLTVLLPGSEFPSRPWLALYPGTAYLLFLNKAEGRYIPAIPKGKALVMPENIDFQLTSGSKMVNVAEILDQIILQVQLPEGGNTLIQTTDARMGIHNNLEFSRILNIREPSREMAWVAVGLSEHLPQALEKLQEVLILEGDSFLKTLKSMAIQQVSGFTDPEFCKNLHPLLKFPDSEVNLAVLMALRKMQDDRNIPYFIAALEHHDQSVRFQAVMGLSELKTEVSDQPSLEVFRQKEKYYLEIWKQWWLSQN